MVVFILCLSLTVLVILNMRLFTIRMSNIWNNAKNSSSNGDSGSDDDKVENDDLDSVDDGIEDDKSDKVIPEKKESNDSTKETIDESDSEIVISKKHVILLVSLIGLAFVMIACFFFYFAAFVPKKGYSKLLEYERIAYTDGIDEVPEDAIQTIENYRNISIILDEEMRQDFDDTFDHLRKAVERWREIKIIMEIEGRRVDDDESENSTESSVDPARSDEWYQYFDIIFYRPDSASINGRYRPFVVGGDVFIIRDDADETNLRPADFPVYEEYQRCMKALEPSIGHISYDEYQELMERRRLIDSGEVPETVIGSDGDPFPSEDLSPEAWDYLVEESLAKNLN